VYLLKAGLPSSLKQCKHFPRQSVQIVAHLQSPRPDSDKVCRPARTRFVRRCIRWGNCCRRLLRCLGWPRHDLFVETVKARDFECAVQIVVGDVKMCFVGIVRREGDAHHFDLRIRRGIAANRGYKVRLKIQKRCGIADDDHGYLPAGQRTI
jgi:hypothetical protein